MIPRSMCTFWYKGSAKTREIDKFENRTMFLKNNSPDSKADFLTKLVLGVWRLMILSRYDIIRLSNI